MATHVARFTQVQNFNDHFDGSLVAGKNNGSKTQKEGHKKNGSKTQKKGDKKNGSKAQKKGCNVAGRKSPNDVSNLGKPSALQPSRKHTSLNVISIGEDLGVPKHECKSPSMTEDPDSWSKQEAC